MTLLLKDKCVVFVNDTYNWLQHYRVYINLGVFNDNGLDEWERLSHVLGNYDQIFI